jgi:hypothetical protein
MDIRAIYILRIIDHANSAKYPTRYKTNNELKHYRVASIRHKLS